MYFVCNLNVIMTCIKKHCNYEIHEIFRLLITRKGLIIMRYIKSLDIITHNYETRIRQKLGNVHVIYVYKFKSKVMTDMSLLCIPGVAVCCLGLHPYIFIKSRL